MEDKTSQLFESELKRLEGRLDELVDVCKQLKEENQSLKQRQDTLMSERASLLQKNEQVRARVEAMIGVSRQWRPVAENGNGTGQRADSGEGVSVLLPGE